MAERFMTLYHGTTEDIARSFDDIYGKVHIEEPDISGNLTDSVECAWRKAQVRAGKLGKKPCVITFQLPEDLVVDHGVMLFEESAHGFSTNLRVDPTQVPSDFLDRAYIPKGDLGNKGYIYRIPRQYATDTKCR